jgi:hypothetical protein
MPSCEKHWYIYFMTNTYELKYSKKNIDIHGMNWNYESKYSNKNFD